MKRSLVLVLLAAAVACNSFGTDPAEFVIKADSVVVPASVSSGAGFTVKVYGFVGPTGCYSFKEFQVNKTAGAADVTVIGTKINGTCTQALVFLEGQPLAISAPVTDPFTLRVHQPDGTLLNRTIRAE